MPTTYPFNSAQLRGIASIAEANRVTLTELPAGSVDLEFFKEATAPAPGTSGLSFLFSPSEPLPAGYTRVRATTRFADNGRFGFAGDGKVTERDQFVFTTDATFEAACPDGLYDVTVRLGDHRDITHDHMGVFFQGVHVGTLSSPKGQFVPATYRVNVTDGRLVMRLKDLGGSDPNVCIRSLVVVPASGSAPVPPPAPTPTPVNQWFIQDRIPQESQGGEGTCWAMGRTLARSYERRAAGVADYRLSSAFSEAMGYLGLDGYMLDCPKSAFPHDAKDSSSTNAKRIERKHLLAAARMGRWDHKQFALTKMSEATTLEYNGQVYEIEPGQVYDPDATFDALREWFVGGGYGLRAIGSAGVVLEGRALRGLHSYCAVGVKLSGTTKVLLAQNSWSRVGTQMVESQFTGVAIDKPIWLGGRTEAESQALVNQIVAGLSAEQRSQAPLLK